MQCAGLLCLRTSDPTAGGSVGKSAIEHEAEDKRVHDYQQDDDSIFRPVTSTVHAFPRSMSARDPLELFYKE